MQDLKNSPFFDDRTIRFVQNLLIGREPRPINATEEKLFLKAEILKNINVELDRQLITRLHKYKKRISIIDCVEFIVGAYKRKMLPEAIKILDSAIEDERGGSLQDLIMMLKESKDMPVEWAVYMNARAAEDRHKPLPRENRSQLNLKAMEDFK